MRIINLKVALAASLFIAGTVALFYILDAAGNYLAEQAASITPKNNTEEFKKAKYQPENEEYRVGWLTGSTRPKADDVMVYRRKKPQPICKTNSSKSAKYKS